LTPIAVTSLETVEHFALARARLDDVYGVHDVIESVIEVFETGLNEIPLNAGPQQQRQARVNDLGGGIAVQGASAGELVAHRRSSRASA
jgi:hypothetical protein